MTKRLIIIGLLLAVVAVGGAVAYWALTPTPGVTVENFKRLHEGMSDEQVVAILGEPAEVGIVKIDSIPIPDWCWKRWIGNGFTILVSFRPVQNASVSIAIEGQCITTDGSTIQLMPYPPTLWDRVHSWLLG